MNKYLVAFLFSLSSLPTLAQAPNAKFNKIDIIGSGSTGDASTLSVTAQGGTASRALSALLYDLPVRPESYKLSSDPDDTLSIQRAANTGRVVALRDDKTYTTCSGIAVPRGVIGLGSGAKLQLCAGFSATGLGNSFFYNKNWSASMLTDTDLLFENLIFDGTNNYNNGTFHAIKVRKAQRVTARNITCTHVGDCTAFQSGVDTLVDNSRAYDVGNVGFDHWEGPQNATVRDTVTTCGTNGAGVYGTGVMFTAASTDYTNGVGNNLLSKNNRVFGNCEAGIDFNVLWSGGSLDNAVSDGDFVDAQGGARTTGIRMIGKITNPSIRNPVLINGGGGNAIIATPDSGARASGIPDIATVTNPRVLNWTTSSANLAPVALLGAAHKLSNAFVKGGSYPYAVRTDTAGATIEGQFDVGTSGYRFTTNSTAFNGLSYGTFGVAIQASGALQLAIPDSTAQGGNTRGANAVDLVLTRQNQFQVASGIGAFNTGVNNSASGLGSSTLGGGSIVNGQQYGGAGGLSHNLSGSGNSSFTWGNSNLISGSVTSVFGFYGSDRGHYGGQFIASGRFSVTGDAQAGRRLLRGATTSATAARLTADGLTAGSANCINIPDTTSYSLRVTLTARNNTSSSSRFVAVWNAAHEMGRTSGAASVTVDGGTSAIAPDSTKLIGSWTGMSASISADTTNGCLNVTFTPPTGSTDIVHVVAQVETTEVQ